MYLVKFSRVEIVNSKRRIRIFDSLCKESVTSHAIAASPSFPLSHWVPPWWLHSLASDSVAYG